MAVRYNFIEVRYRNSIKGRVDDLTLDELIQSKEITHFYRPFEDRWVDISVDPVRKNNVPNATGRFRRASDWEGQQPEDEEEQQEKPRGLLSRLFKRRREDLGAPQKQLDARDWFEKGFLLLHTTDDGEGAVRAFAASIRLNPTYDRAYLNRGMAYERLGNLQQAIGDYSRAIFVNPDDPKVYYLRGLALKRMGMREEAVADMKKAAGLGYRPADDFLKPKRIPQ